MRIISTLLFSLLFSLALPTQADTAKVIRLAGAEWPPYTGQALPHKGLAGQIVVAAFARGGIQAEFALYPWARAQAMVKEGTLDGMGIAWYTEERAATMAYSRPFVLTDIILIKHRDDDGEYREASDLDGKRFSILRGYGYRDLVASDSIHKTVVDGLKQSLFMVSEKRVDLTLEERLNAHHVLQTQPRSIQTTVAFVKRPLQTKPLHITLSKNLGNHRELIDAFNRGLQSLIDDGSYANIIDGYHPRPSGIVD